MNEIIVKKPTKPLYDCEEIKTNVSATELYIIFLLETICTKLKIPIEEPD